MTRRAYKVFDPNDPDFFKPRGNMFLVTTRQNGSDYNFAGTDIAKYPTAGANLYPGGPAAPGHGVYVKPAANRVIYINGLRFAFNITSKSLHEESFRDRVSTAASPIELMHSGVAICTSKDLYDLTIRSHEAPQEVTDAFASNNYLYGQHWTLDMPGRVDGDVPAANFGLRTNGGNGIYLGASFAANAMTHLHIQISGWVVNKVDVTGSGDYQEIIYLD